MKSLFPNYHILDSIHNLNSNLVFSDFNFNLYYFKIFKYKVNKSIIYLL